MFGITNSICGVKAKFIEFGKKDKNSWKNSKNKRFLFLFSVNCQITSKWFSIQLKTVSHIWFDKLGNSYYLQTSINKKKRETMHFLTEFTIFHKKAVENLRVQNVHIKDACLGESSIS